MAGFSREVARRVFAEELRDSNYAFREGEGENQYAPQYILIPTGARCNRVFMVGTLTEKDDIGTDTENWKGRLVDPTGSILIYAGQYQLEAAQALSGIEPPAFIAVVGKPNLYEPEEGNVIVSIRAEAVQKVDEATRNRWILDAARRTQERIKALEEIPAQPNQGFSTADKAPVATDAEMAKGRYNTDVEKYRQMVLRALTSLRADLEQGTGVLLTGAEEEAQEKIPPRAQTRPSAEDFIEEPEDMEPSFEDEPQEEVSRHEVPRKAKPKGKTSLSTYTEEKEEDVPTIRISKGR